MSAALYQPAYLIALTVTVLCLALGLMALSHGYEMQENGRSVLIPIA